MPLNKTDKSFEDTHSHATDKVNNDFTSFYFYLIKSNYIKINANKKSIPKVTINS